MHMVDVLQPPEQDPGCEKPAPGLSMCSSEAGQHKGIGAWHMRQQGHSCVKSPAIIVVSHFPFFEPSNALLFLTPEARGAAAVARGWNKHAE